MHKMVKTYNIYICYYESESKIWFKTTMSTVNSLYIFWNLDVTFTLCQAYSHGGIVPKFVCASQTF